MTTWHSFETNFIIPVTDDDPNDVYFEINLHKSWMKFIDAEWEEYGMDRMYFVKELVKLGMVAWKADEEELPEHTHRPATQP